MNNICFNKTLTCITIIFVLIIILFVINYKKNNDTTEKYHNENENHENLFPYYKIIPNQVVEHERLIPDIPLIVSSGLMKHIKHFDQHTLADPLYAPRKRDDYTIPIIPYATRGYPTHFRKVGMLVDPDAPTTDPYKFLLLIGRQKYINSDRYDYYATEKLANGDASIKFDITRGRDRKEFYTGDSITIHELNRTYVVKIDEPLDLRYDAYV